jgi:hypothetical protein
MPLDFQKVTQTLDPDRCHSDVRETRKKLDPQRVAGSNEHFELLGLLALLLLTKNFQRWTNISIKQLIDWFPILIN